MARETHTVDEMQQVGRAVGMVRHGTVTSADDLAMPEEGQALRVVPFRTETRAS